MSTSSSTTTDDGASGLVSPEVMLKRIFGVAKLLAIVSHQRDVENEIAENRPKNQFADELQYREGEQTEHT